MKVSTSTAPTAFATHSEATFSTSTRMCASCAEVRCRRKSHTSRTARLVYPPTSVPPSTCVGDVGVTCGDVLEGQVAVDVGDIGGVREVDAPTPLRSGTERVMACPEVPKLMSAPLLGRSTLRSARRLRAPRASESAPHQQRQDATRRRPDAGGAGSRRRPSEGGNGSDCRGAPTGRTLASVLPGAIRRRRLGAGNYRLVRPRRGVVGSTVETADWLCLLRTGPPWPACSPGSGRRGR
jgi:hypothetical protein